MSWDTIIKTGKKIYGLLSLPTPLTILRKYEIRI